MLVLYTMGMYMYYTGLCLRTTRAHAYTKIVKEVDMDACSVQLHGKDP